MRIAILMASAGSRVGGLETAAREFAAGLGRRGHYVTLITGSGPGARLQPDLSGGSTPYRLCVVPMLGQPSLGGRMLARARRVHPSIVEARTFWSACRRSRRVMRLLERSEVVSAHFEVEAVEASQTLGVPVVYYYAGPVDPQRLARGRFARMVAISRMVADYHAELSETIALPKIDSIVLPGIREEQIANGPAPNVSSDRPEAICTGRIDAVPQKRVEKLVEWWPRVARAVPRARLTLVGGGTGFEKLRSEVRRLGLEGSVSLPGPLPHEQVFNRLRRASLYAFPSQMETFGIAPLEALAAGLPVVASDIPALRESLGSAATLVPMADDEAWVDTLIRFLSDPALRLSWAQRGPERARLFTWARQSEAYEGQLLAAAASGLRSPSPEAGARRRATSV